MQRDRRLAGAGAALHDEHAAEVGADHPVLLGLDRLDDVAHPPGAGGADGGEQGRLAGQPFTAAGGQRDVEDLVVEGDHRAVVGADVAPAAYPVRVGGGRQVERPGGGRPPVDQQRVVRAGVVEDPDAAHVAHVVGAGVEVEAAEAEPRLHRRELGELFGVHADGRVALGPRLGRAAGGTQGAGEPPGRLLAQAVQALVEHGHVLLLGLTVDIIGAVGQEPCPPGMKVPTNQDNATPAQLNRSLLARQGLLARSDAGLVEAVEAFGAIQAQQWSAPPLGLWNRLRGFAADDLWTALERGDLLTGMLMRRTLHLVSAREHPAYSRVASDSGVGGWLLRGVEPPERAGEMLADTLRYAARVRTGDELTGYAEKWVAAHPDALPAAAVEAQREYAWRPFRAQPGFVRAPADGQWSKRTPAAYRAAPAAMHDPDPAWDLVVRRHLAAFGPAGADDVAYWLGCPVKTAKAVLERLDPVTLGEQGSRRVLYDLPSAPRPDADVEAPPRLLPAFDGALLGYAANRRGRILPDAYRDRVYQRANLRWLPTLLVDGMVAGTWSTQTKRGAAVVAVTAFAALPRATRAAVVAEAEELARFVAPAAKTHEVTVTAA